MQSRHKHARVTGGGVSVSAARTWWRGAVCLAIPLAFGLYAVHLGRDANWDLQSYHWYNPYALLHWRYDRDVAPAQGMSFFAPLLHVPWFWLGSILPARALGFVIGAVQSINLLLLYYLALAMLPVERRLHREAVALLLAAVGMGGGMSLGLLGTTFVDSLVSIGILGSVLAVVASLPLLATAPPATAARRAALAAIPAALAVAGKLTVATFAVGLAAGLLVIEAPLRRRLWLLLWFGIGGALTATLTDLPWLLHLWSTFGDPFYPFFAKAFQSPFAGEEWSFERWKPHRIREALVYPLVIAADSSRVAEVPFTDLRIAAAYVLVPLALGLRLCGRAKARPPLPVGLGFLLVVMAVGYALWLVLFCYYRYAVTLELLAPLAIALAVMALPWSPVARSIAVGVIMLGLLITTRPADWGHLPWTRHLVEVSVPPIDSPQTATLVLIDQPVSYVIPSFPPELAVIDLEMAYWDGGNRDAWARLIRTRLAARSGPLYALVLAGKEPEMSRMAAPFGLALDAAQCRRMPTNLPSAGLPAVKTLMVCPMARTASSSQ
jgi:hypothetical protein